jgi:hypothetical protein
MATTYYGRVVFRKIDGTIQSESITGNDTTLNYITFDNMGALNFVRTQGDCWISDIQLTGAPATIRQLQLFVDGRDTGIVIPGAGLAASVNNRIQDPIGKIRGGSIIQIKQI